MIRGPLRRWSHLMQSLAVCRRGNVMMIFALAGVMLIISLGVAVDMWRAYTVKTRLQAALDSAGLAVASSDLAAMTPDAINTRLQAFFNVNYPSHGVLGTPSPPVYNTTDNNNIVTVSASASVPTTFMNIVGISTMNVAASAQVTIGAPNIDFYLLLDSSPSMALPATQDGITQMVTATGAGGQKGFAGVPIEEGGCAFACHESNPPGDKLTQKTPDGTAYEDNYYLAKTILGLTLRIDLLNQAAQNLMNKAQSTETGNNAIYRMAIYTFDVAVNKIQTITSDLTSAQTAAQGIKLFEVYTNNNLTTGPNNDEDTNFTSAMTTLNSKMPNPGNGTNASGDTPQEVLFLVTDGVEDESVGGTRTYQMTDAECSVIKNRGIRIAVLYTTYLPLTGENWYDAHIAPFASTIPNTMESCASPGLYTEINTGGDISAALTNLFIQAVNTAYLSR